MGGEGLQGEREASSASRLVALIGALVVLGFTSAVALADASGEPSADGTAPSIPEPPPPLGSGGLISPEEQAAQQAKWEREHAQSSIADRERSASAFEVLVEQTRSRWPRATSASTSTACGCKPAAFPTAK